MSEVLIKAEGVSKKFCKDLKHSMFYGVQDIFKSMIGLTPKTNTLKEKEFWAVNDISFELKRGECLGLIGPNGSGKSTLLKMLNGIIDPDKGRIEINGKVGALIEVGAGFHPMLTGRENIYINGSILGFSKKEIDRKFDAIVDFAELEDFIDTPVKHYSSGMYVRLGFAVAAQMEPDVLLIDEVLAVGDVGFRAKCLNAIGHIIPKCAVVLISHNMPDIARVASKIIALNKGSVIISDAPVSNGINRYHDLFIPQTGYIGGDGRAKIDRVLLNRMSPATKQLKLNGGDIEVSFLLEIDKSIEKISILIGFLKQDMQIIAQSSTAWSNFDIANTNESVEITSLFKNLFLNPGTYYLVVTILDVSLNQILTQHYATINFQVTGKWVGYAPIQLYPSWKCKTITN